jgi:hypothetical protein
MTITTGVFGRITAMMLLAAACTGLVIAAPWAGTPASARTHARIARAVLAFDFWLVLAGIRGKRRRDLRADLRANLYEAAAETASTERAGPDWDRGLSWAAMALGLLAPVSLVTTLTWADAAHAGHVAVAADRPLASPWLLLRYTTLAGGEGVSMSAQIAWWVVLIPAGAFAVGVGSRLGGRRASLTV